MSVTKPISFMKTYFPCRTLIALAVAAVAAVNCQSQAGEPAVSTSAGDSALPAGVALGSPVGQVFKLAQAGVDPSVIQTYISNCPGAFNLQADEIIALTDAGVSSEMMSAMFAHDKTLPAPAALPVPAPASAVPVTTTEQAGLPPPAPVAGADTAPVPTAVPADLSQNEIDQTLTPYGSWVQVDGYGRCWRPSVVVYDATWQPYCDRGRWVYTDYGWYWNSDYAWGVTFHYGRWFNSPKYGWCWWPNTVWAPAWVTWRSSNAYCGWAPLPPFTAYQPGIGFVYRGNHVTVGFDFGLAANCFTFVSVGHFCEPHPRYYCVPHTQVAQIYGQTAIINNYGHHDRTIVNDGVSVTIIGNAAEHSSAVLFALKDRVDVTLEIAIGSSVQVALFVAPALVFISLIVGHPMDFIFSPFEVAAVGVSTLIVAIVIRDGRSNWLEGAQLLGAYAIMAISFFFVRGF